MRAPNWSKTATNAMELLYNASWRWAATTWQPLRCW